MTVVFIVIVIVIVKGCDRNLILGRKEEKKKINFSFSETVIVFFKSKVFFFPLYLYSTHVFYLTLILGLNILLLKCGTLILRHQQDKNNPQGTHGVYFLLIC